MKASARQETVAFDRDRDTRVNGEKAATLHAYGIPCYWIAISPVEAQALLEGVVSAEIQKQAATCLRPAIEEEQWFG